jgi:hypothetical protein
MTGRSTRMSKLVETWLLCAGVAAAAGAIVHVAILFGGPDWYAFFGAPRALVEMARAGHPRAAISCVVIATILSVFAAYAFSGAGLIRRLPLLRTGLALIGGALVLRGLLFVPLLIWLPGSLSRLCDCRSVDTFIVVTSLLCLLMGIGYALGARAVPAAARG